MRGAVHLPIAVKHARNELEMYVIENVQQESCDSSIAGNPVGD